MNQRTDDNFSKYFGLMLLLFGCVAAFVTAAIIIFFTLKFFSITIFRIPGADNAFKFFVTITPYLVFFGGYYYLFQKVKGDKSKAAKVSGKILMTIGCLLCFVSMIIAVWPEFDLKNEWLRFFNENTHYSFIIQILLLFFSALVIASGDPKEKNWMERSKRV